ncbi:hypothetical protein [Umezawaea sp. Da 62-37]|uniref:hypothetical protein n=1 Tax=Umezawaea sp. Da 62-37 TaxID=3075927 RepID=UPI0028F72D4A|nr:hypothetical protein [Umezawaea sp. Da 62-37]WNV83159.1 hypothetical protein RM788_33915 [Umezawaea sp. Da 62-37]
MSAVAHSRIQLQPVASAFGERMIITGWNDTLQTYYAQIHDLHSGSGDPVVVLDMGNGFGEVDRPEVIVDALRHYAVAPENLDLLLHDARHHPVDTFTDLRPDSRLYQYQVDHDDRLARMYRAGGFVTNLDRSDTTDLLDSHGWHQVDVQIIEDGHAETFARGDQSLQLRWAWPYDAEDTTRLVSPVIIDGEQYGFHTPEGLAGLLFEGMPDNHTLTADSEDAIDLVLRGILGDTVHNGSDTDDSEVDGARVGPAMDIVAASDTPSEAADHADSWLDQPPEDDLGYNAGMGL